MSAAVRRTTMLRVLLFWLAGVLVIGLGGPAFAGKSSPADAPTTTAVASSIRITSLGTPGITKPAGVPDTSFPSAYVVRNVPFVAKVEFFAPDDSPAPLSTTSDTKLQLTVQSADPADVGKSWTVIVPKGVANATFTETTQVFEAGWDNAHLIAKTVPQRKKDPVLSDGIDFDVLISSGPVQQDATNTGVDGEGVSSDACSPTPADPVCADLRLKEGLSQGSGLLSIGACDNNCSGQLVQVLIGLNATRTNPATLIMKCDKSLCPGSAIKNYDLYFTLAAEQPPSTPAPACTAKGVVDEGLSFCVDYVQSTRDNAGDTFLYLLFTEDAKVRFP